MKEGMKSAEPDIRPGQSTDLLKELHILTRDGRMNQDSRRKLKQVYHLYQFIEKLLLELPPGPEGPTLADHGAGKSYLGFILYDLFFKGRSQGHIYGIETRGELVEKSRALGIALYSLRLLEASDAFQVTATSDQGSSSVPVTTSTIPFCRDGNVEACFS
jgi:hypothetical protein